MIHTAFMRFAIDVIFVDRTGRVVRVVRDLGPWRIAASLRAYATIELASGALESRDVAVGDRLYLEGAAGAGFGVGLLRALSPGLGSLRMTASSPAGWVVPVVNVVSSGLPTLTAKAKVVPRADVDKNTALRVKTLTDSTPVLRIRSERRPPCGWRSSAVCTICPRP